MVLFTLLGLYALFQRERKKGDNTHSGQDENVDQSDDLQPLERNDGQTSQDISSDPVVLPITEELTGDPQFVDDCSQDQSVEERIIDDPQVDDDWRKYLSLELPSIDNPQVDEEWNKYLKLKLPIIDDPKDDEDWRVDVYSPPEDTVAPQLSQHQDIKGSIIDQTSQDISSDPVVFFTVEQHICQGQSVEERIIDNPQVDNNWRKFLKLELPIIDDPKVDKDLRVDVYSPPEDTVAPQSSQHQDIKGSIIDQTSQDISSDPVVFFTVEEHICQDQSVEERIIDEPQVNDNWRRYLSLELPSIDNPQVDDNWRKFLKLELPIIDDPKVDKDWRVEVYSPPEDTVAPQSSQQQDTDGSIIEINSLSYKIGNELGQGGFGTVFEATRLLDDVQVAVKFASKMEAKYISVDGYCRPLPKEVMLHILASEPSVPQIIQLLDWQDQADQYIMVLERPMPCQSLDTFLRRYKSPIDEDLARVIMRQAALAARICCQRGVFHRDIKLENLLINPDTLEVKLIDFGCGALLKSAGYTSYSGTREYRPLECIIDGRYHGEPATVWSLGIVLFVMLYRNFPRSSDLGKIFKEDIVTKNGFSQECCDFMCSCLQFDPKKRIKLENVLLHDWLKENDRE